MTTHQIIALMQFEREFIIEEEPKDTTRHNYTITKIEKIEEAE